MNIEQDNAEVWPIRRSGHGFNYYDNKLYMFGGYNAQKRYLNDFWCFDIKSKIWKEIITNTDDYKPTQCFGLNSVIYKHYVVIFGGKFRMSNKVICYNDLYIYNILSNEWRKIECQNKPDNRRYHGMAICNGKLVINGGLNMKNIVLGDLHCIDMNKVIKSDNNNIPKWVNINNTIGKLNAHVLVSDGLTLYCFGGNENFNNVTANSDLTIYHDLAVHSNKIKLIDKILDFKFQIYLPNLVLQIIGDYIEFIYKKVLLCNQIKPRIYHNGCFLINNNNNKKYLFVFGGSHRTNYFDDSFLIKLN